MGVLLIVLWSQPPTHEGRDRRLPFAPLLLKLLKGRRWWLDNVTPLGVTGWEKLRHQFPAIRARLYAPITFAYVAVILGIYVATMLLGGDEAVRSLVQAAAASPDDILAGEWWRAVTHAFVHGSWRHVRGNSVWILLLGVALEPKLGSRRFVVILLAAVVTTVMVDFGFYLRGMGASSVGFALLGAYLARPLRRHADGRGRLALGWLCLMFLMPRWILRDEQRDHGGHEVHMACLIAGLWCGMLLRDRRGPSAAMWTLGSRITATSAVTLALITILAMDPRWAVAWHVGLAGRAENNGDRVAASRLWKTVEGTANPWRPVEARALIDAAWFRDRNDETGDARRLLVAAVPTMDDCDLYLRAGSLLMNTEPRDERNAMSFYRRAVVLRPDMAGTFNAIAEILNAGRVDTTKDRFLRARVFAARAVALDRGRSPHFLRSLAQAHFGCGQTAKGVIWMRRALTAPGAQIMGGRKRAQYESELAEMERKLRQEQVRTATRTGAAGRSGRGVAL